ncbi:MAG: heat-inducible transcription repressor HrcA [Anaerolineales bacterium]|nr:MAG: heat-inducible transcription repressor HrcA [Anaerolineales bacterium]
MEKLTDRRQAVLGLVVRQYIATAIPVGSKTIVEQYGLGISSATIRNEMAYLEEQGYLTHPHTSAGRVPTEKGYRYFVERLMSEAELPLAEQRTIRHQFHQARLDLEQWMRLAAAVLARAAHSTSLVAAPTVSQCRFKHLELIAAHGSRLLLVLVLRGGIVKQRLLTLTHPVAQEELNQIANRLNDILAGLSADQIVTLSYRLTSSEEPIANLVIDMIEEVEMYSSGEIYRDGLLNIFRQPEFSEIENVRQIIGVMEEQSLLEAILTEVLNSRGVRVIIGGEGRWEELSECSVVLAPYGKVGRAVGALGVLGPMRMRYGRAISTVRYVADLLSDLIYDLYE